MNDMWNELQRFRAYLLFKMTETVNVNELMRLFNPYLMICAFTMLLRCGQ